MASAANFANGGRERKQMNENEWKIFLKLRAAIVNWEGAEYQQLMLMLGITLEDIEDKLIEKELLEDCKSVN
jgi:hypothetical protein